MSDRTRYQAQSVHQEHGDVTSYLGVDPVTGLPVLIYRFQDVASQQLARLDSEHLPRLLAWRDDDAGGIMVVAWSSAWVPAGAAPLDNLQLLDSARALSDAAAAGVTHGDLTPERFMIAGDSVVIEGFGVPWQKEATSSADDVRAWSASVRQLGHTGGQAVDALLSEIDSGADMTAAGLLTLLTNLLLRGEPAALPAATDAAAEPPAATAPAEAADSEAGSPDPDDGFGSLDRNWDDFAEQDEQARAFSGTASQLEEVGRIELDFQPPAPAADAVPVPDQVTDESDSSTFIPSSTYASERLSAERKSASAEPAEESGAESAADPAAESGPKPAGPENAEPAAAPEEAGPTPEASDAPAGTAKRDRQVPAEPSMLPAGGSSSYLKSLDSGKPAAAGRSVGVTGHSGAGTGRSHNRNSGLNPDGTDDWPASRSNRRTVMIIVLVLLSAVLVSLLFVLRQRDVAQVPAGIPTGVTYVIDVLVEPDNLPPVNLFVLQSPPGSQFGPDTALGTAPRRMALDTEGTWVFEGRFQGRISEPVTIRIPEQRSSSVIITIPPEEGPEP